MKKLIAAAVLTSAALTSFAQHKFDLGTISGNFQTDAQYYFRDSLIDPSGEAYPDERLLASGFLNLTYTRDKFMAGVRYENYQNNRVGLPPSYKGEGITYRYARYMGDRVDVTVGNFYEQFGSGLVLRAYEERGLGIDNNLDGIRLKVVPAEGLTYKAIIGRQRNYFDKSSSVVRGFDTDWNLKNSLKWESNINLILGGSIVSKYQEYDSPLYEYPNNVASGAARFNLITGSFNIYGEYAYKANDPSGDNLEIYKPGEAFYLSASYAKNNFGLIFSAKRYDNFSWRSQPNTDPQQLLIGYLPSATTLHTYTLPALYSYNTVLTGEQGFQIETSYKFDRKTALGGKYGTYIGLSAAISKSIDKEYITRDDGTGTQTVSGTDGYKSVFDTKNWGFGDYHYFTDLHLDFKKKLSKSLKLNFSQYFFDFNEDALRKGVAGVADIGFDTSGGKPHAYNIHASVVELLWKIKPGHSLRTELQGLWTDGDRGDWALALFEYSISPKWFFAVQDAWNYGNPVDDLRVHYISVTAGYTLDNTRFQLGYGRQQQGVFCVGGICRTVPASNGFSMTITSNF